MIPSSAATTKSTGHDPLVGSYDEEHDVDTRRARDHGPDESLVAGNIHDPQTSARREVQLSKAQLDGDAPRLFLREAIAVYAGQGLNQRRLTVVDVSRCAEDQLLAHPILSKPV
jgi:hypothetical protein